MVFFTLELSMVSLLRSLKRDPTIYTDMVLILQALQEELCMVWLNKQILFLSKF